MGGQSSCVGCGSEFISCGRESLLTKMTREPCGTVIRCGLTPLFEIVMVKVCVDGTDVVVGGMDVVVPTVVVATVVVATVVVATVVVATVVVATVVVAGDGFVGVLPVPLLPPPHAAAA